MCVAFDAYMVHVDHFAFRNLKFRINDTFDHVLSEIGLYLHADVALSAVDILKFAYGRIQLFLIEDISHLILDGRRQLFAWENGVVGELGGPEMKERPLFDHYGKGDTRLVRIKGLFRFQHLNVLVAAIFVELRNFLDILRQNILLKHFLAPCFHQFLDLFDFEGGDPLHVNVFHKHLCAFRDKERDRDVIRGVCGREGLYLGGGKAFVLVDG